MTTSATHTVKDNTSKGILFLAFELSENTWKLGFTTGPGQKPRERNVTARDQERVLDEIAQAKRRLGLPETAPVVSCYEGNRSGDVVKTGIMPPFATSVRWPEAEMERLRHAERLHGRR